MICGDFPTSVTNGTYVQVWKTFEGIKRALKRYSENGSWGMSHWKY